MSDPHGQLSHSVRFDWGPVGGAAVADGTDVAVIVDVLGFAGTVATAIEAGEPVVAIPHPATPDSVWRLRDEAVTVVAAGLRNAPAVADWIAREHDADRARIAVVAGGKQWPDGSLRPAAEDLWGAGAVLATLEDHDWPGLSPEAALAADAYRVMAGRELTHLTACASGQQFLQQGRDDDLAAAAAVGASSVVPLLGDRGFVAAP